MTDTPDHVPDPDATRIRRRDPIPSGMRLGMALLMTVLLILALSSLSAGMLWLASTQNVTASAQAQRARLRLEAEGKALDAFSRWQTPRPRHRVGESWMLAIDTSANGGTTIVADRLTSTLTLLRITNTGRTPAGHTAIVRVGLLVRTIHPGEFLASFPAALTAATVTLGQGALVDAEAPASPPDGWFSVDCPDEGVTAFDSLYGGSLPGVAAPRIDDVQQDGTAVLRGHPPVLAIPALQAVEQVGLGPIPWNLVSEIADLTVEGSVHPAPAVTDGRCVVERTDNWGQPGGVGPCSNHAPVVFAPNGVTIAGGAGQGVLVVRGDVTLREGARFYGAVLASGNLLVTDSALIVGAARAGSATIAGASLQYRVCPLWHAVLGAPALRRAFRPKGRWWLPDYARAP